MHLSTSHPQRQAWTNTPKHCACCHGPEKEKGDLRFDKLSRDFKLGADTHHWAEAMEQVNSGEMPPKKDKDPKPTQAEFAAFVTSLNGALKAGRTLRRGAYPTANRQFADGMESR